MKTVGIMATVEELYPTDDEVGEAVVSTNEVVTVASTVAVVVMGWIGAGVDVCLVEKNSQS